MNRTALLGAALALVTLGLYAQVLGHDFVNFDDDVYVTENPQVLGGLSAKGVRWAFTTGYAANWHPLTWLSHMLDVELFDLDAGAHHATSALLHATGAVLLFAWLARATRRAVPSALVAGFFAWHPLRAESVAWVAERKDVLAGVFFFATLLAYTAYAKNRSLLRYLFVLSAFAAGLLCKPMLVTLPVVLLLLDRWPLARSEPLGSRLLEKLPLFMLAAASAVATLLAQQRGGALDPLERLPFEARFANGFLAAARYLGSTFVPSGLACFYPHPAALHPTAYAPWNRWTVSALALLVLVSALALSVRGSRPYLFVGWMWFLVMLAPVSGLVQVGIQSHADRYTYLPLVGIAFGLVWWCEERFRHARARRIALGAALLALAALLPTAWRQSATWRTSRALFEHALAVTRENFVAHTNLGEALEREGKLDEALAHYESALRLAPHAAPVHYAIGRGHVVAGRYEQARAAFRRALELEPSLDRARVSLGVLLSRAGEHEEAARELSAAWERDPPRLSPADRLSAGQALAWLLATSSNPALRDGARAREIAETCLRSSPAPPPELLETLAAASAELADFESAVRFEEEALKSIPSSGRNDARKRLDRYRRGLPYRSP